MGQRAVLGVQVDVVGDQELAGADHGRAALEVGAGGAEVGPHSGSGELLREPLVLALPDRSQIAPGGARRRVLVEVDRDRERLADPLAELSGEGDAIVHGRALERDEGADVGRAEARMGAPMALHVDPLGGDRDRPVGRFGDRVRRADEGHDRAMGVGAGIDVEQADTGGRRDGGRDRVDRGAVTTFREIGDALDERSHGGERTAGVGPRQGGARSGDGGGGRWAGGRELLEHEQLVPDREVHERP